MASRELTPSQEAALNQVRDLTNGGDDDVAIGVLESVEWDVQRAADMIFGTGGPTSSSRNTTDPDFPESLRNFESFEVDDSEQASLLSGSGNAGSRSTRRSRPLQRAHPQPQPGGAPGPSILTIITYPLHLLSSLFRFVFSILRIPLPHVPFLSLNLYNWYRRPSGPPRSGRGIEAWIRELEEETGAVCISRAAARGTSSGIAGPSNASNGEPSSSKLTSRGTTTGEEVKFLPDFQLGAYEHALRVIEKEARIGCIVVVSEEHDDVAEFKRSTLTNPAFVNLLSQSSPQNPNSFYVWGGDVRDREVWSAAQKLGVTTYPCISFISLQPGRTSTLSSARPSSSQPTLTVLSRHAGAEACQAEKLLTHLQETLLPRVSPYLQRLQEGKRAIENERRLREEQDRAFEESKRRDTDRILAKMRAEEEEKRRVEQAAELERLRVEKEAREKEQREQTRRWFRKHYRFENEGRDGVRIAVRMPDGKRLIRKFGREDSVTALYAYVDTQSIAPDLSSAEDPASLPSGVLGTDPEVVVQTLVSRKDSSAEWWGFTLASSYPRQAIPWAPSTLLSSIDALKNGGQLVVELADSPRRSSEGRRSLDKGKEKEGDDDGYVTESSDEE